MPTYEYVCTQCKHTLELFQQMTAEPKTVCPKCRKHTLERQIGSGAGIIFRGAGFYATDYRKPAPKSDSKKPDTDKPDTKKPDTPKSPEKSSDTTSTDTNAS